MFSLVLCTLLVFVSKTYQLTENNNIQKNDFTNRHNSPTSLIQNQNQNGRLRPTPRVDMNINDRVDYKLDLMRKMLLNKGYDPMDNIPDIEQSFSIRPMLITYHGKLKLKNGWMQDLKTISRLGDAFVKLNIGKQLARLSLIIPNLEFGFDYSAKLMHLGPTGSIIGTITDIEIYLELYYYVLQDYYQIKFSDLYDIGKIDIKLTGNILTDPIANLFVGVVTEIVHDEVINIVNSTIYNAIDDINEIMHP